MSHGKKLLPFWAPPSAGARAYVFLDTNKSYNKKVNELCRQQKIDKIESQIQNRNSCWLMDEHFDTKLKVMMRPDDAKECTFTPKVGTKMPTQYKDLMMNEYANWAGNYLSLEGTSFHVQFFIIIIDFKEMG
jgi:hypothetical protein